MNIDILAVVAHPDDAELMVGGTLARAADQGHSTGILDLTAGELGSSGTRETRALEAQNAARILGVRERVCANLPDGALENSPDARRTVGQILRRLRPRVVITHWPQARHPDHAAASALARDASFLAGLRNAPLEGEPHRPGKILHSLTYQEPAPQPSFVFDISNYMDRKLEAIFAFGSQFANRTAMGDVLGGGNRPLRDQILAHHAHYGALIRAAYAEPFFTRETIRIDDIVALGPGSF